MPASKVQADHEYLQKLAQFWSEQADYVDGILQYIKGPYEELVGGGWIGEGARKYQQEQESFTHKKLANLSKACQNAARFTSNISKIFEDAEAAAGNALHPE
jgi:WXG100 family type VII secretion target